MKDWLDNIVLLRTERGMMIDVWGAVGGIILIIGLGVMAIADINGSDKKYEKKKAAEIEERLKYTYRADVERLKDRLTDLEEYLHIRHKDFGCGYEKAE